MDDLRVFDAALANAVHRFVDDETERWEKWADEQQERQARLTHQAIYSTLLKGMQIALADSKFAADALTSSDYCNVFDNARGEAERHEAYFGTLAIRKIKAHYAPARNGEATQRSDPRDTARIERLQELVEV